MKPLDASKSPCKLPFIPAILLTLSLLLLSACGQTPIQEQLTHPDWQISGKIGFRQSLLKGGSASFNWSQQDDHYIIHLFNPVGRPELSIKGNKHSAIAIQSNGDTFRADTPEQLMQQIVGWSFPVQSVKLWLQGKTLGTELNLSYNDNNQLQSFDTPAWHASIDRYKAVGEKILPHRIKLENNQLRLTIIIKQHHQHFL